MPSFDNFIFISGVECVDNICGCVLEMLLGGVELRLGVSGD
jgi:hypothetical protein